MAGGGSTFSTRGRLENFHTKKKKKSQKRVIVQNGKPEKDGRDARAVNIMERALDLKSHSGPATYSCVMALGMSAPALGDPPPANRDLMPPW